MEKLRVFSQRLIADDVVARFILEARASQVIRLLGYRIDLQPVLASDFGSVDDRVEYAVALQAKPRAPVNTAGASAGTVFLDSMLRDVGTIGFLGEFLPVRSTGGGGMFIKSRVTTGWVDCDLEVPGLWMWGSMAVNGTSSGGQAIFTLKYDWVSKSPIQVAALYTTYGIDAIDATEREAVGEINFSRAIGEGEIPALIG